MNYIAFVLYKQKLKHLTFWEAQRLMIDVAMLPNPRLVAAMGRAVQVVKPELYWWYKRLVREMA